MLVAQLEGRFLEAEFKKADHDRDGKISLQDFISYYEQIAYYQAQTSREGRIKSATYKHQVPVGECGKVWEGVGKCGKCNFCEHPLSCLYGICFDPSCLRFLRCLAA